LTTLPTALSNVNCEAILKETRDGKVS